MDKEKIDSSLELMDDILDSLDKEKEPEHTEADYKSLETKLSEEVSKREKLESDYQDLFLKYKERFTDTVSNAKLSKVEDIRKEEPEEEVVLDIRSIF